MSGFGSSDIVQDQSGNALANVKLNVYGALTDAKTQTNLLATVTTNSKGQWPVTVNGYDMVWVRDPAGNIWSVASDTVAGDHASRLSALENATGSYELQSHASSTYQPVSTFDATQAGNINASGSQTDTALKGKYVAKGSMVVNVKDYGATGTGLAHDDTTAITNAINAVSAGGTVFFPASSSFYNITSAIPLIIGVNYVGAGRGVCEVRATAGNVFAPTGTKSAVVVQGLTLSAYAAHVIDLGTGSNGLYQSTFRDCAFVAGGNGVSIVNGNGPCAWQEVYVENCVLSRQPGATVPAVNIITSSSGGNGSVWQKLVFNNNSATGTPFMHIENSGSGNYLYDTAYRDIVGEQNVGGMFRILSPYNVTFENITDYDVSGSYTASLIKVGKSATGPAPQHISVKGAGNRGGTINGTTVFHVEIAASANDVVCERVFDSVGNTYIKTASPTYGVTRIDGWGASGNVRTTTANATAGDVLDGTLVMNGASLTATLPDPTTVTYGRKFTIKNINASSLTVVSAGTSKTIDGAASQSLAQWAKATYQTDGTQWLTVG